jgi:ABC-type amino acid transport substrate-binding protein
MVTLLAGCGKSAGAGEGNKDKNKKVIKVGMEVAYPPFEFYEDDGKTITGIDYDLTNAIAKELGYKVEFVPVAWEGIFAGLDKGDYDVIMSAITITPERAKKYSFTTPYIQNYQCLVTMKDAKKKPKSIEELKGMK